MKILYGKQHNDLRSPIFLLTIYFRVLSDETETKIIITNTQKRKQTRRNIRGGGTFFSSARGGGGIGGGALSGMTSGMEWGG